MFRLLVALAAIAVVTAVDVTELPPTAPQFCAFIGAGGILRDPAEGNRIPVANRIFDRTYDIPTEAPPSNFFRAQPFTQDLVLFEEFGVRDVDVDGAPLCPTCPHFPIPANAQAYPDSGSLDAFLSNPINPLPQRTSNTDMLNPWRELIADHLNAPQFNATMSPAEGRPANEDWAHQRWDEFPPVNYIVTASTGARTNSGFRDQFQMHGWSTGEFGEGGLYHRQNAGIEPRFHPNMPIQNQEALWTFDGTFPPKLVMARYGKPIVFRHYNGLAVDMAANRGFGVHTLTTHEHNGHSPAESDGFTNAFFFPGQFYDYRWPMQYSGLDFINTDATDERAATPDVPENIKIPGDWRETMSTHWMHDHMLDFTAQNVYKGIFAMLNFYSVVDRGNEGVDDGINLRMPSGTALPFGNRDYDVNLVLADKAFDGDGQLWYNPENLDGFLGDVMTVNLLYKPKMDVRARKYRFRILNGAVSRFFQVALMTQSGGTVPFHMIGNDGNIMEHTVFFRDATLPVIGIGERYDIIVDFTPFVGQQLYFVNVREHTVGRVTARKIDIQDIVDGTYTAFLSGGIEYTADPVVGPFLEFNVVAYDGVDLSMDPDEFLPVIGKTMIPLNRPTDGELRAAVHRTFEYEKIEGDLPWAIGVDQGESLNTNPEQISAKPRWGSMEVWRLLNSGTWSHPIHIHAEEAIILSKDGQEPPEWEKWARKDVFRVGPEEESAVVLEIAYRFRDFNGTFMNHCHNTLHEDKAMLIRYDVSSPQHIQELYTPVPCWGGGGFSDSFSIPTVETGDGIGANGPLPDPMKVWIPAEVQNITFPNGSSVALIDLEPRDEFDPGPEERTFIDVRLTKGVNIDSNNVQTEVYFILHDVSDEEIADSLNIAWGPLMELAPQEATSPASYDPDTDSWTFFGDLPPPIGAATAENTPNNDYTPLRQVVLMGKDVKVNAIFIWWGAGDHDHLRIDVNCVLPDYPPSTSCKYNGEVWAQNTGQVIRYNLDALPHPTVTMKLHKAYSDEGDYLPYYIVTDSFPFGTSNAMGVSAVQKYSVIGLAGVPLIQFLPPHPIHPSYPPTESDGHGVVGGGPLGGQVGIPSYFMPGEQYSPFWHIGFAHWKVRAYEPVQGIDHVKRLRAEGKVEIREFPAAPAAHVDLDDFDFDNPNSPHVVNCPVPVTLDTRVLEARIFELTSTIDLTGSENDNDDTGDDIPPPVDTGLAPAFDTTLLPENDASSQLTAGFVTLIAALFFALF